MLYELDLRMATQTKGSSDCFRIVEHGENRVAGLKELVVLTFWGAKVDLGRNDVPCAYA